MNFLSAIKLFVKGLIFASQADVIRGTGGAILKKIDPDLIDDALPGRQGLIGVNALKQIPTILPVAKTIEVSHKLPKEFEWINKIGQLPKTMEILLSFCGVLEKRGADDNPTIVNWARELNLYSIYNHDSIAWCGLIQGVGVSRAGYAPPKNLLAAKSWLNYGVPIPINSVCFGDIVVLNRDNNPALGHVFRYVGETKDLVCGYGGNQSDSMCFAWFSKSRIAGIRRDPFKIGKPESVKKYWLTSSGKISTNEA